MPNVRNLRTRPKVDHIFNPKISAISLNASKSFLDRHLLDNGDGTMEFFYGEQL